MTERLTAEAAHELAAASEDGRYGVLLRSGTMELGFYKPGGVDPQQPHDQDEIYIVQCGSGTFVIGDKRRPFSQGEALFVPAGAVHRFENFSDDFAAWVVFYGPPGGETE
jgi:mannose-6-phosphate isomerase-like protein (cupin superfamily)